MALPCNHSDLGLFQQPDAGRITFCNLFTGPALQTKPFLRGMASRKFLSGVVVVAAGVLFHFRLFFGMAWGLQLMRPQVCGEDPVPSKACLRTCHMAVPIKPIYTPKEKPCECLQDFAAPVEYF